MRNVLGPMTAVVLSLFVVCAADAQDSLSLQQCVDLALKNNCAVKNSILEIKAAQQTRQAALTNYFPSVSAGCLQWSSEKPLMALGLGDVSMGFLKKGSVAYVGAVQPLFAGGRIINGNRLAGVGAQVATVKGSLTRDDVILKTEEQYWQIISLQEKGETIRAYEQMLDSLAKQVDDAYASGVVMQNDVMKVRVKRSEVLLNKSRLDNGLALARMAFCQHLGLPLDTRLCLTDSLSVDEPPQALRVSHAEALTMRGEYKLLDLSVKAEKLQTSITRGEYLPQAAVGVDYQRTKFDDGDGRSFGMVYGTVSIPISGWWGGSHELKKRRQDERIAENNFRDKSELLLLQMEKCWQDLTDGYTQYLLSQEARAQGSENMKVNQDSYDNGLTPVSDLLEARAQLQQAEDQLTDAKMDYSIKRTRYLQITGRKMEQQ